MTLSSATTNILSSFPVPSSCVRGKRETMTDADYRTSWNPRPPQYSLITIDGKEVLLSRDELGVLQGLVPGLLITIEGKEVLLSPPDVAWFLETAQKVVSLGQLELDWDGYGAPLIGQVPILLAIRILAAITQDDTPEPYVFPTSNGGVQFEWHTKKANLEVEITGDSKLLVLFDDADGKESDWEMSPDSHSDLGTIIDCVGRLT